MHSSQLLCCHRQSCLLGTTNCEIKQNNEKKERLQNILNLLATVFNSVSDFCCSENAGFAQSIRALGQCAAAALDAEYKCVECEYCEY